MNNEKNYENELNNLKKGESIKYDDFGPIPCSATENEIKIVANRSLSPEWIDECTIEIKMPIAFRRNKKYDFESQLLCGYTVYVYKSYNVRIPYNYLQNIAAYKIIEDGILFIKCGRLYKLDASRREYSYIADVHGDIFDIDLKGNKIILRSMISYKKIIDGEEVIYEGIGLMGYRDVYSVDIDIKEIEYQKENIEKKTSFSKLDYWEKFVNYAFHNVVNKELFDADFPEAKPADRNWYALRLGSAKVHVELSINTQKNTARVALLVKDENTFSSLRNVIDDGNLFNENFIYNSESKTQSISIIRNFENFESNYDEQFNWFIDYACKFKKLVNEIGIY